MRQHQWMDDGYRRAAYALICLLGGALNHRDAGDALQGADLGIVAQIARRNDVEGLAWCALDDMRQSPGGEFAAQLKSAWSRTLYRQLCFDAEREEILREMAACGLSYLPLKGILIAGYYPEPGMRSMADNDILYGFTRVADDGRVCLCDDGAEDGPNTTRALAALRGMMEARGYTLIEVHGSMHDAFHKKPFFNFEMHRGLISQNDEMGFYYAEPWSRALPDADGGAGYHFRDEDEYIYDIVHALKHMGASGSGIRFFADLYVFLRKKGANFDRAYVARELEKLGLVQTEERLRQLALTAFDHPDQLTEAQREALFYHCGCGVYGTIDARTNILLDQLESKSGSRGLKLRYITNRLFLPKEVCRDAFPQLYKHRLLRPFIPVYRIWSSLSKRPQVIRTEIRSLFSSRGKS